MRRVNTSEGFHLIGTTSVFIASKFIDYDYLDLDLVVTQITHNKLSHEEIRNEEINILQTIGFKIEFATTYDFIQMLFVDFFAKHEGEIKKEEMPVFGLVKKRSIYFAVMCCYNYEMLQYK